MKELRAEFKDILMEYGYPVLLVRQQKEVRCSCYDEKTQSVDRECPICFGLGHVPLVEKHTIREIDVRVTETNAANFKAQNFGDMATPSRGYFFLPEVVVDDQDLILDVGWSGEYPILNKGRIWEVSHVDTARFVKGEIVFKKVYVKAEPVELKIRGFHIRQVEGITSYELIGEKKDEV